MYIESTVITKVNEYYYTYIKLLIILKAKKPVNFRLKTICSILY